jgi:hypothetical protein
MTRGTHPSAGFFLLRRTPNSITSGSSGRGVLSIEAILRDFRAARRRDLISGKGVSGVTERRTVCLWFLRRRVMCSGVGRAARSSSEVVAWDSALAMRQNTSFLRYNYHGLRLEGWLIYLVLFSSPPDWEKRCPVVV